MNHALARKVADAVLYEGYMLYPYRPSAIKNRQRWSFGILYPPSYSEARSGTERSTMHSECLIEFAADAKPTLQIQLRFLHLLSRQVVKSPQAIDERSLESWDEGVERTLNFDILSLAQHRFEFSSPGSDETEMLRSDTGQVIGTVRRTQQEVFGAISVESQRIGDGLVKLLIDIANTTPLPPEASNRDAALLRSLLSAHTIVSLTDAQFVSLLDPPPHLLDAASSCKNVGNFPVLVGTPPERDILLCSPIVLYDYPQIAPESASDFYDATEMDEMLTLRVMTLTDDEKDEMRRSDNRVRDLLERTEQSAREQLRRTHGTIRSMRPAGEKQ
jgi:hydrogenase maturation protease